MAAKHKSGYDILKEKYTILEARNAYLSARFDAVYKDYCEIYKRLGWFRRWLWNITRK